MQQLTSGTLLRGGTYKIEKVLGQGSFGITYLAEHIRLDKKVAIKEFFMKEVNSRCEDGSITGMTDGSLSYNYCLKFQKEAINLSRLEHPNIVRVTDSFSENGTFYYVMDYIEGQNLNDYIKYHPVNEDEAVDIIKSVAYALIYMHEEKHMLHLDLKPGNIMRRASDGHIFLIDFGLSKHYNANGQPETSTNIGLGTAGYAPIEQGNQARSGEFRPTIDVYALGATLYKLLTRETPPPASELVSDDELVEDNLRAKHVSEGLIKVVADAMCPSVRKRIQTVSAFMSALTYCSEKKHYVENTPFESNNSTREETILGSNQNNVTFKTAMSFYNQGQYSKSFPMFEQLANSGDANAMFRLGVCYYWDEGIKRSNPKSINFEKCRDWMQKAAKLGNCDAMLWLGYILYSNGEGVPQDDFKALKYIQDAFEAGNYSAGIILGFLYVGGTYVTINEEKGHELARNGIQGLLKKSDLLSREEMHKLAYCYQCGVGTEQNIYKALYWYEKSADLGDPEAQDALGKIYLYGTDGVTEDEPKAFSLFRLSATKNLTSALYNMGNCYYNGWGTPLNYTEAIKWYKKAIEEGDNQSMLMLGICYREGNGVEKNYKKAEEWFLRAQNNENYAEVANYLGLLYHVGGYGIAKDIRKAQYLFKEAASKGETVAQYNLGMSLLQDEDESKYEEGIEWIRKAADNNYQSAIDFLNSINNETKNQPSPQPSSSSQSSPSPPPPQSASKEDEFSLTGCIYIIVIIAIIVMIVKVLFFS